MDIYFINESSLPEPAAYTIAWACDRQARFQYGRSGWRADIRCVYTPNLAIPRIPASSAILHLLDTADQAGALGYHDEAGNEVPYARVFVKTTQDAGESVSEVASHEMLELATDPHVNLSALTGDASRLYALEIGDPVQGTGYDVGLPEATKLNIRVANFALPAWYDPNTTSERVDFRSVLRAPFTVAPQGYVSYLDMANPGGGWQQSFGQARAGPPPPDVDDRLGKRGGGFWGRRAEQGGRNG